jgi:hypothetical protein
LISALPKPPRANRYDGPGNGGDEAFAIAVDRTENVFVTGYASRIDGGYDSATIKYSSSVPPPRLDFQLLNRKLELGRRILSSLAGLDSYSRHDPAMNRWAILEPSQRDGD